MPGCFGEGLGGEVLGGLEVGEAVFSAVALGLLSAEDDAAACGQGVVLGGGLAAFVEGHYRDFEGIGEAEALAGGDGLQMPVRGECDAREGFAAGICERWTACACCALARSAACGKIGGIEPGLSLWGWIR